MNNKNNNDKTLVATSTTATGTTVLAPLPPPRESSSYCSSTFSSSDSDSDDDDDLPVIDLSKVIPLGQPLQHHPSSNNEVRVHQGDQLLSNAETASAAAPVQEVSVAAPLFRSSSVSAATTTTTMTTTTTATKRSGGGGADEESYNHHSSTTTSSNKAAVPSVNDSQQQQQQQELRATSVASLKRPHQEALKTDDSDSEESFNDWEHANGWQVRCCRAVEVPNPSIRLPKDAISRQVLETAIIPIPAEPVGPHDHLNAWLQEDFVDEALPLLLRVFGGNKLCVQRFGEGLWAHLSHTIPDKTLVTSIMDKFQSQIPDQLRSPLEPPLYPERGTAAAIVAATLAAAPGSQSLTTTTTTTHRNSSSHSGRGRIVRMNSNNNNNNNNNNALATTAASTMVLAPPRASSSSTSSPNILSGCPLQHHPASSSNRQGRQQGGQLQLLLTDNTNSRIQQLLQQRKQQADQERKQLREKRQEQRRQQEALAMPGPPAAQPLPPQHQRANVSRFLTRTRRRLPQSLSNNWMPLPQKRRHSTNTDHHHHQELHTNGRPCKRVKLNNAAAGSASAAAEVEAAEANAGMLASSVVNLKFRMLCDANDTG